LSVGEVAVPKVGPLLAGRLFTLVLPPLGDLLVVAGQQHLGNVLALERPRSRVLRMFEEITIGDAVLAGGEAAAMVAIEACVRLVPGVLGQAESLSEESFEDGLLEHPQYTRPRTFEGHDIPEVLLSGHHAEVRKWRQRMREETTRERRPDLWAARTANQQAKGDKAQ
jgi:tRNA (guanine-N1)-methyltransferase